MEPSLNMLKLIFNVQQEALRKQEAEKAGRPYTPLPKPVNKKGRKIVQKNDGPGRIARLVEVDGVIHAQVRHQVYHYEYRDR